MKNHLEILKWKKFDVFICIMTFIMSILTSMAVGFGGYQAISPISYGNHPSNFRAILLLIGPIGNLWISTKVIYNYANLSDIILNNSTKKYWLIIILFFSSVLLGLFITHMFGPIVIGGLLFGGIYYDYPGFISGIESAFSIEFIKFVCAPLLISISLMFITLIFGKAPPTSVSDVFE